MGIALPDHEFWPDTLSIVDPAAGDDSRQLGPRQLADIYLLALAARNGGRFVTLDTNVAATAVRDAKPEISSLFENPIQPQGRSCSGSDTWFPVHRALDQVSEPEGTLATI
ncbi:MAG: hypothetical protein R3D68_09165 [Hyphomicrobiaceae bacterium]